MRVVLIDGKTPREFADKYNSIVPNLKFVESQEFVDSTTMYVFYQEESEEKYQDVCKPTEPEADEEEIELKEFCADCRNYRWGKGCVFKPGKVIRPKHEACEFVNMEVPNEEVQS